MADLKELGQAWLQAKAAEVRAVAQRLAIEEQIVALTGKRDEGSKTHDAPGLKIVVTGKVTRKMDWKQWNEVVGEFPAELRPVKLKPELDERGVKWLAEHRPDLYAKLPMEVKPAKTAIEVKAIEE